MLKYKYINYKIWSFWDGIYLITSCTLHFKIQQKSFIVLVVISLLFLILLRVLKEIWCSLVSEYQFSLDFSNVSQNGV